MSDQTAEVLCLLAALIGLFLGAWSAVRSEARHARALRDEILQAVERAEVREPLDGRALERRVADFRRRTGRDVQTGRDLERRRR